MPRTTPTRRVASRYPRYSSPLASKAGAWIADIVRTRQIQGAVTRATTPALPLPVLPHLRQPVYGPRSCPERERGNSVSRRCPWMPRIRTVFIRPTAHLRGWVADTVGSVPGAGRATRACGGRVSATPGTANTETRRFTRYRGSKSRIDKFQFAARWAAPGLPRERRTRHIHSEKGWSCDSPCYEPQLPRRSFAPSSQTQPNRRPASLRRWPGAMRNW